MKNKIGVAIITCNREEMFKKCLDSIPNVDSLVVINDGTEYSSDTYNNSIDELIQHSKNKPIGVSKNEAIRHLVHEKCDHIFTIEDDIFLKDPTVFEKYIETASKTGVWHLNFGYHGPANKNPDGSPRPRQVIDYGDGVELGLNLHIVGAFSYYLRGIIKQVGYIDERFHNAWDHLEHTYRIIRKGLHPPFWWFADIANSNEYIGDQDSTLEKSVIRKGGDEFMKSFREGMEWYKHKHGCYPTETPDMGQDNVISILEGIKKNYAKDIK